MAFSKGSYPSSDAQGEALRFQGERQNLSRDEVQTLWNDWSARVLEATDIADVVGEVVALRVRGNELIGLCPFHNDSNPSFQVSTEKGIYSCWSCSAGMNGSRGGDAVTFVRRYFGMSFREAIEHLAQRASIPNPFSLIMPTSRRAAPVTPPPSAARATPLGISSQVNSTRQGGVDVNAKPEPLLEILRAAQRIYASNLNSNEQARAYLHERRGISTQTASRFLIGYAQDGFNHLKEFFPDYETNEALVNSGLVRISEKGRRYDFFRDRLMFGVRDEHGGLVGFGGRRLSDEGQVQVGNRQVRIAKYLNSPETAIFDKSQVLFGLYEAQKAIEEAGIALVVEGYMDVIGLANQGIDHAVACMGTALSESHIKQLASKTRALAFCFDGDKAGHEAAFRSLSSVFAQIESFDRVLFLTLPDGLDPDAFVRAHGKDAFLAAVENSQDLYGFWTQALMAMYPSQEDADRLWENAMHLIHLLPPENPHITPLAQIAARLSNRSVERSDLKKNDTPTVPLRSRVSGLSSFVANEPSERLYLAVEKMPHQAAKKRNELAQTCRLAPAIVAEQARDWQRRFDQALALGLLNRSSLSSTGAAIADPLAQRRYGAIVDAAPEILAQFLKTKHIECLIDACAQQTAPTQKTNDKSAGFSFDRPR